MMVAPAVNLAGELQQRVIAFNAGDEKYSGEWLANFQRAAGAWQVCAEKLQRGAPQSCDEELLQEFCAQTLARLARAFVSCHSAETQRPARDGLEALLLLHAQGRFSVTWKQLALALVCADLWLGSWTAAVALSGGLPAAVQRELLSLPTELLFSRRALPLGDGSLRQAAAHAFFAASAGVFPVLTGGAATEAGPSLTILASWLHALRKSAWQVPGYDEAGPLRCLAAHVQDLLAAARRAPAEACEVAQQLARWGSCDQELAPLLQSLLASIFSASVDDSAGHEALLPLLTDLASDCWPRACLGSFGLDWQAVTTQAIGALRSAMISADSENGNAEAALAVWQTFAIAIDSASKADPPSSRDASRPESSGVEPPEKRSRRRKQNWQIAPETIAQCKGLPFLFNLLVTQLLELFHTPMELDQESIVRVWEVRNAAIPVFESWAALAAETQEWQEAAWGHLRLVGELLAVSGNDTPSMIDDHLWSQTEVVLWFSGTLAQSWPKSLPMFASLVLNLKAIDGAPVTWRALLWSSACSLVATSVPEHSPAVLEWMLQRSPMAAGAVDLFEFVELQYAQAVASVCEHLPQGNAHAAVGERLFQLAFARWPPSTFHEDSLEVQGVLLQAMRRAMGGDEALLCSSIAQKVLPLLRQTVDSEAAQAPTESDPQWLAAQVLFSTLVTLLPLSAPARGSPPHPAVPIWRECWGYAEAALLRWPSSSATEQPAKAAAEAVTRAAHCLPELFTDALYVLKLSATQQELPDVQLQALREVALSVSCPPMDAAYAAEHLAAAIAGAVSKLLLQPGALLQSPATLVATFQLLSEAVRPSPEGMVGLGLCEDRLRAALVTQPAFLERCLAAVGEALPHTLSAEAAAEMARFVSRLLGGGDGAQRAGLHDALAAHLPALLVAVCNALVSQEHLLQAEALAEVVELLVRATEVFPNEMPPALGAALAGARASEHSRGQFMRHISGRVEKRQEADWMEQVQRIVAEWQAENRRLQL